MKKFYGFITLLLLGIYIAFLYIDSRRIFTYTTERYYFVILVSGLIVFLFGLLGVIYTLRSNSFTLLKSEVRAIMKDKKFVLILILCALGVNISPFFILFASILILIPFKDSALDIFLSKNILKSFLLILVIFSGIFLPSGQISSATADQRIGNLNSINLNAEEVNLNSFNTNSENYDIGDWIISQSYNPDLSSYKGKKVNVSGFIFAPSNLPENNFIVARFVIRCCAADATPVGLKVQSEWRENFKTDEWVKVEGYFEILNLNGVEELVIIPDKIEKIDVPERPYIT